MWLALEHGGPLGVVAVRLADSLPAFVFGLHGGIAADRWSRRKLMVGADLVRGRDARAAGRARARRVAARSGARRRGVRPRGGDELLRAGLRRDDPGDRRAPRTSRAANALVQATAQALSIGGWALAAALLAFLPLSTFFAIDAARSSSRRC